ncbi:HicB family protein [Saccharopolyspora kobensis]|uniref:HicB family protein n=1 Tax=Saccharopolyspora kobensis TaxID=146035 RepID=A0A1H6DSG2_9PSEU|nr:toxin-antitoxin system HicB family antitoxin [Saccharopolyspora kobensis]SEG87656.1 HicB family protein [Saccharopolyspora kobensis]SFE05636.1 HicB family protein [Saccharopolyspora kobensis]
MDLTSYVDNLRHQLAVAAEASGEDARALAERLTAPLDSAIRLTLLDALSAAADEITRDLAPGSVDLRLRGGNPGFVVTPPPAEDAAEEEAEPEQPEPQAPQEGEDGAMTRINLRLPEHLKAQIEAAANRDGLSANAWLVRAASAALEPGRRGTRRAARGGQHYTGWVR